ncbi:hypothetical protein L195_g007701 [Trifolium pratense]|uniref:Uncharacterized protein n=1 Tax=Trifolium pratense TaxID=57577 RepID=A0A2K3P739_TRIPR|nr:hypothetical protein L195_g007701 [Trifolium pratense]
MDGAREAYLRCGCGGLIRGDSGEWIGGFSRGLESSVLVADLWGVWEGHEGRTFSGLLTPVRRHAHLLCGDDDRHPTR